MSTTTPPPALRDFWNDLPHAGRLLLSVVAIQFIGSGLIFPFVLVYLHQVRHFSLGTTGLLLSIQPLVALLVVGPVGSLIDHVGARVMSMFAILAAVAGDIVLMFSSHVGIAAAALVLVGLSQGIFWPSSNSLIGAVIPEGQRQRYYGLNFTLLNVGFGVGGIIGGVFIDVHRLWTFQTIYLVDAAGYVPALLVLLIGLRGLAGRPERHHAAAAPSYLEVLRRPAVPTVLLLNFVAAFVGYGQLSGGMTAFATTVAHVSTHALGFAYALNTIVIVALQLLVLQRIEGRRRTRVVVVMGAIWAVSWLLLGLGGLVPGTLAAALLVCAMATVFGMGEMLLQPTIPVIVNDLADDRLRGRFNALSTGAYQLPSMIAPPIAGALLGAGLGWAYIAMLLLGCALLAWMAVVRLEPQLPPAVNGLRLEP